MVNIKHKNFTTILANIIITTIIVSPLTCKAMKTSKVKECTQLMNENYHAHELRTVSTMPVITTELKDLVTISKSDRKNSSPSLPQYKKVDTSTQYPSVKPKCEAQRNRIIKLAFKEIKETFKKNFQKS